MGALYDVPQGPVYTETNDQLEEHVVPHRIREGLFNVRGRPGDGDEFCVIETQVRCNIVRYIAMTAVKHWNRLTQGRIHHHQHKGSHHVMHIKIAVPARGLTSGLLMAWEVEAG